MLMWHYTNDFKIDIYNAILKSEREGIYPNYPIKFFFKEEAKWIGVDNSDNNCWVEEFDSLKEAIEWLKGS